MPARAELGDDASGNVAAAVVRPPRWKRVAITLAILLVVYANVAVIVRPLRFLGRPLPSYLRPPIPREVEDAFLVFGMFSYYETRNREVYISGRVERVVDGKVRKDWIDLDPEEYVPFRRPERMQRLWARREIGRITWNHRKSQEFLARKIKERYARIHPGERILELRIYALEWPRSADGYFAEKRRDTTLRREWFVE